MPTPGAREPCFHGLVGKGPAMRRLVELIQTVAASNAVVTLLGESGTGKELVARALHEASPRAGQPFVPINCGALSPSVIESELFGHEKGAFTGADSRRRGAFEEANGGTLFLDEVGELPLELQARLLRVLDCGEVKPVGASRPFHVDVRVVAATHRELRAWARQGKFREDLYYRLGAMPLVLPPLRSRRGDIRVLAEHFVRQNAPRGQTVKLTGAALAKLQQHAWPGNVRELRNVVNRALLVRKGPTVEASYITFEEQFHRAPVDTEGAPLELPEGVTLEQMMQRLERQLIESTLRRCGNHKDHAAKELGLARSSPFKRLKEWGLGQGEDEDSHGHEDSSHSLRLLCLSGRKSQESKSRVQIAYPGAICLDCSMIGPIEDQLLEQAATSAYQLVAGVLKSVGGLISEQNAVQNGMREYARLFLERYGNIKVLNMTEPIPLREIYVAAQAISPRAIQSYRSPEELQAQFRQDGRRRLTQDYPKSAKRNCLDLANEEQFLNVLGAPGAGKSTFLRRLGLEALRPRSVWDDGIKRSLGLRAGLADAEYSKYTHELLPVLIELRRFRTEEIDLVRLIQNELELCGLPKSEALTKVLLEKGHLLLLLDGVDEIPGERLDGAIAHIKDFVDRHSRNRFVVSCRTAFYKNYLHRFSDVLLADFDDQQISSFVNGWFRSDKDRQQNTAGEFLTTLNDPSNTSSKELASTPLLLTFLCLAYDETLRLPPNRSELYRQALEILLFRWATSKRVHNEPVYRDLHIRLEINMLTEIAAPAFREGRYFFTRRELIDRITSFLHDELNAPKTLNGDQVLEAIEVQQGLIVQRAQDVWSFSHLTLQEYLTAVWYEQNHEIKALLDEHLHDERWREVFILLTGVFGKADVLLSKMLQAVEKLVATDPLMVQILQWASTITAQAGQEEQTAARRAYAITLLRDYAATSLIVRALNEGTAVERARSLQNAINRERSYDRQRTRALVLNLDHDLRSHLLVTPPLGHLLESSHSLSLHELADNKSLHIYVSRTVSLIEALERSGLLLGNWAEPVAQLRILQEQALSLPSSRETLKAWEVSRDNYANALCLPAGLRNWTGDLPALDTYIYVCRLLRECKDAATSISRSAWNELCQRMLSPPRPPSNKARSDRTRNQEQK